MLSVSDIMTKFASVKVCWDFSLLFLSLFTLNEIDFVYIYC